MIGARSPKRSLSRRLVRIVKSNEKIAWIFVFLLFLIFFVVLFLPLIKGVGNYWDWSFPYFKEDLPNYFNNQYLSWTNLHFGSPLSYSTDYFFRFLVLLFSYTGLNPETILFLIVVLIFTLGSFGVFLIAKERMRGYWAFIFGIVAFVNPAIFYKLLAGHLNYLVSYAVFVYFLYYLLNKFERNLKSSVVLGLIIAFIGSQVQFFFFAALFLLIFFLFRKDKFSWKNLLVIIFIPILVNLFWLFNFILGVQNINELSNLAKLSAFPASAQASLLGILSFSFSKATLISTLYSSWMLIYFLFLYLFVILFLAIFWRRRREEKNKVLSLIVYLLVLIILGTGFISKFEGWPANIFTALFREIGHFAPVILLTVLVLLIVGKGQKGHPLLSKIFAVYLAIFIAVNTYIYFSNYPALNFEELRKEFPSIQVLEDDETVYRVLTYPFFNAYSFNSMQKKEKGGYLLNNSGYDSFIRYSGEEFVSGPNTLEFRESVQYKLLNDYDLEGLRQYNIKYIIDLSDVYESNIERYIPASLYDNDLSFIKNDEDFFQKLKSNNPGKLTKVDDEVWKIKDSGTRVYSLDKIFSINSLNDLEEKKEFVKDALGGNFNYILKDKKDFDKTSHILRLFESLEVENLENVETISQNIDLDAQVKHSLYNNTLKRSLYYKMDEDKIRIYSKSGNNLLIGKMPILFSSSQTENEILTVFREPGRYYYIQLNGKISLTDSQEKEFDLYEPDSEVRVYSFEENGNLISNGSFEEGFWQEEASDCNKYDDRSFLFQMINEKEKTDGENSLELWAKEHIACTAQEVENLESESEYLLAFDYQSPNAEKAGYFIEFDDEEKTKIYEELRIKGKEWHSLTTKIKIPKGADSFKIFIHSYSEGGERSIVTRYDNFRFYKLTSIAIEKIKRLGKLESFFESSDFSPSDNSTLFEFKNRNYSIYNLIENPSFEDGMWQESVGDCHNFDNKPEIHMKLNRRIRSEGNKSIELQAKRHIACTATKIKSLREETEYEISFDFQSPNAEEAGFYLKFDDKSETYYNEKLPNQRYGDWQEYSKLIKTPKGAKSAVLFIHSYPEEDEKTKIITRYDNFRFFRPYLDDHFYLISQSGSKLEKPESIDFEIIAPTKRKVTINSIKTSFFLVMSDSYHKGWRLLLDGQKLEKIINKDQHFKLNNFSNIWFIDFNKLKEKNLVEKNFDGTYDLKLVIDFWPQRYFSLCLVLSILTILVSLIYILVFNTMNRRRR